MIHSFSATLCAHHFLKNTEISFLFYKNNVPNASPFHKVTTEQCLCLFSNLMPTAFAAVRSIYIEMVFLRGGSSALQYCQNIVFISPVFPSLKCVWWKMHKSLHFCVSNHLRFYIYLEVDVWSARAFQKHAAFCTLWFAVAFIYLSLLYTFRIAPLTHLMFSKFCKRWPNVDYFRNTQTPTKDYCKISGHQFCTFAKIGCWIHFITHRIFHFVTNVMAAQKCDRIAVMYCLLLVLLSRLML